MELPQLKYFLSTISYGSIREAAEQHNVSQSAISMAIARLEKEFDVELFQKQGRNITPTKQGRMLAELVQPAIAQLDFAAQQMVANKMIEPNIITLSVEMGDFATFMEYTYMRKHPNVLFHQALDTRESMQHKLLSATADFAISFEPFRAPDIVSVQIFEEPTFIQVSFEHPLADKKSIALNELASDTLVSFSSEYGIRRWMDEMCFIAGFRPARYYEVCDSQSLLRIVSLRNAITFIGRSTADWNDYFREDSAKTDNVRTIPLTDDFCKRTVYLLYNRNRVFTQDAVQFLDYSMQLKDIYKTTKDITAAMDMIK